MFLKKTAVLFIIPVIVFAACNNKEEDNTETKTVNISTEQKLKGDVANYPDSLLAREKLIEYYRNNGNYDSAIRVTNDAIKKDSDIAELWDMKATLHFENEDTPKAIKAFETAININPAPEYIISLGSIYAQTKNPKALVLADALLLSRAKAEKEALFIKGLYYSYAGDKKKAINYFDSCIHLDYTFMFAYREKAIALYDLGKYEEALQVLTKGVTIQNNFDEGYYWMGMCYEKLNRKDEAIQSYHTALLYDKDFIEAREGLERLGAK